ncbi:MAG TPA: FHA domain-containing serine/threonine-protein kinase [Gemmataceae bacterium]|nr:FHA domain-containing serine/threonine-protein kinase [Gemmataceae bacterium]
MPKELRVIAGPDKGTLYRLFENYPVLLGRSRHAFSALKDLQVSRVHCEVELEDGQVHVTDMDSSSGTFLNGKKIHEEYLKHGDILQIGQTQLQLHVEVESGEVAARPAAPAPPKQTVLLGDRLQELSGKSLSHFHVGKLHARGQSGLIFQARDFKDDSVVALKVLFPGATRNAKELRRFVRSMRTVMPLRHPNLVTLHGAGKSGPYCWVAMEFVEGESLSQVIQRIGVAGMLDWRHAFRVAVHIAHALEYAHENAIIHRNLTPQNILIRKSDKTAKLGDLMLAKALEGTLAEQLTRPGEILGDLRYMSPERTVGGPDVDGRSDLYSLGALLYAMLTGRPPFEGSTLVETIMKIRTGVPAKPQQFQMSIPDRFQGVVLKLLEKRPEDRYQTAGQLLKELERVAKFSNISG